MHQTESKASNIQNSPLKGKYKLHYRNIHKNDNFLNLIHIYPELKKCIKLNKGKLNINYKNPKTIHEISKVLLHYRYGLSWKIPEEFLVPTIPSRANYIHFVADLLTPEHIYNTENIIDKKVKSCFGIIIDETNSCFDIQYPVEFVPKGKHILGLDIGIGANSILSILCNKIYSWNMIGTEISARSLQISNSIIQTNHLEENIKLIHQENSNNTLFGILDKSEIKNLNFSFLVCNPPYYASIQESENSSHPFRFRGSQEYEVITNGGELAFILKLYNQSLHFPRRVIWFTSQVSKLKNLKKILNTLRGDILIDKLEAIRCITLKQGKHDKWMVAWSFYKKEERVSLLKFLRSR